MAVSIHTTPTAPRKRIVLLVLAALLYTTAPAQTAQATTPAAGLSALGKIVNRLADSPTPPTGRDWAELARETVTWGGKLQTAQYPVPPGPVHDALHATTLGEALDPQTADWPQLRSELEALLQTQDQQAPETSEDQSQQNPDQNKTGNSQNSQGNDQQENQDGSQDGQNEKSDSGNSGDSQQQKSQPNADSQNGKPQQSGEAEAQQSEQEPQSDQDKGQQSQRPQSESLGDMNEDAPKPETEADAAQEADSPTPPPSAPAAPKDRSAPTQQVGGVQPAGPTAETSDPALAASLQKLEQIKSDDSPAQLFQLMDDTPRDKSANASKKNW